MGHIPKRHVISNYAAWRGEVVGYRTTPISSLRVFLEVVASVRADLPRVTTPLLVVHSTGDMTVPVANAPYIAAHVASETRAMRIYHGGRHLLTLPPHLDDVQRDVVRFLHAREAPYVTASSLFDLPYIFDNFDELHKVTDGPVGKGLFKKLESKGIVGLAFWDNGFKDFSANKAIKVPADYKGLKMRIQSSKVLGDEIKALGGIPQVMAFSEVYQALQTGVVDGTENPPSNFYTQKMNEVQKYLAMTDHGVIEYAVIANKKFWDGLPADVRSTLEGAMKDATKYANDIAKKENDDALEAVRKAGKTQIIMLTADEKAQMKKALVSVHKENESRVGKDTIAEVYKETGFKP